MFDVYREASSADSFFGDESFFESIQVRSCLHHDCTKLVIPFSMCVWVLTCDRRVGIAARLRKDGSASMLSGEVADEDETNSHVIRRSCCCLLYGCRTTGRPCILKLSTLEISGLDQSQKPFAHTAALRIQLVEATPEGAAKVVRGTYGKHT
jgi:hypothetical protein